MGRIAFAFCWVLLQLNIANCPLAAQESTTKGASINADCEKFNMFLGFIRDRNAREYAITAPNGIDEAKFVEIGGIQQWITIRGENRNNPVILFLHGGPGDATNPWGYVAFRLWLKAFTVVQWDQRGAGRTLGRNGPSIASTITIARMVQDGVELAKLLQESLHKPKIILVGHSWGSVLGILMAKAQPNLFYAFVGTGQVADEARNYTVAYEELLKKAIANRDERAVEELKAVGPPPYKDGRGYGVQRKWANMFEGANMFISSMFVAALGAPGYSLRAIND